MYRNFKINKQKHDDVQNLFITANQKKKKHLRGKTVTGVNFYKKDMVVNEMNQFLARKRI